MALEEEAAVRRQAEDVSTHFTHVIGGQTVASADGRTFASVDPTRAAPYATVAEGGQEDVNRAVRAARRAFDDGPWPRMSTQERRKLLNTLADRVEEEIDDLARMETQDMGKVIRDSRGFDMPRVVRNLRFFADFQDMAVAEVFPNPNYHVYSRYEPKGVVAAISPWNFPLMLASWKVAPALAFGNTVVLKPAEQSPATATRLGELAAEVLPEGVFNVVHGFGPDAAGEMLVKHPGVDLITFTGESRTGSEIMRQASATLKPVSLELGGKSPNIVFADADLDRAVAGTIQGIFGNQGEVCLASSRLFVEDSIHDEFIDRLRDAAQALVVGDPFDESTDMGPLVDDEQRDKVEQYIAIARADGAELVTGGGRPASLDSGYFVQPTILTDVPTGSRAWNEEIFGPVLLANRFTTEDEAVTAANSSLYGLASMVWTENLSRAHRVSAAIETGVVWVNCFFIRDLRTPFGGAKRSGIGREGGYHSRDFFTEPKTVTIAL
jgi:aminomuconate-semialdehyde/2-hydroxymuconate-6-semialdehyde dehydrogenase